MRQAPYDAFLTHDWGTDELGRDNHGRVSRVNRALRDAGYAPWFDEEQMRGNVKTMMADSVDASACVVVFITERYIEKASGKGPSGENDNCFFELNCALHSPKLGVARLIPVVMEPRCKAPGSWMAGTVKGSLAQKLYVDLCDDERFDDGVAHLIREITTVTGKPLRAASAAHPQSSTAGPPSQPLVHQLWHSVPESSVKLSNEERTLLFTGKKASTAYCGPASAASTSSVTIQVLRCGKIGCHLGMAPPCPELGGYDNLCHRGGVCLACDGVLGQNGKWRASPIQWLVDAFSQGAFSQGDTICMVYNGETRTLRWHKGAEDGDLIKEATGVPRGWHFGASRDWGEVLLRIVD